MKVIDFPKKESVEDAAVSFCDELGDLIEKYIEQGVPEYFVVATLEQIKTALVMQSIQWEGEE